MAKKTCAVNRDLDGQVSSVLVKDRIKFNLGDQVLEFSPSDIEISEPIEISETQRTTFDINVDENKIGYIEVRTQGLTEVQVTHAALESGTDNSEDNIQKNTESVMLNFSPEVEKYLKEKNLNIVENKGKGVGKQAYITLGNLLSTKYGKTLVSDVSRTDEAEGMWNNLYRNGLAEIRGQYNPKDRKSYTYAFKPDVTVSEESFDENFILSQLFEQIKQLPFITVEQALDIYKNIYRPNMSNWQNSNNTENLNELTGEPLLFYKADNGEVYSTLQEALKNSATEYSIGFMNNSNEFESFAVTPIFEKTSIRGTIQDFIKNEFLKPVEKAKDTYEAQDSLAAEFIEDYLAVNNIFAYERVGDNFIIKEPTPEKSLVENIKELGAISATQIALANKETELKTAPIKPKEVVYNENQLYNLIQSFMKKLGISETTIENYKKLHYAQKGIEPDAKVFIDINSKLIATVRGKATLDELSEEVAHFIVEAWNQEEVSRMLPYVKDTTYYAQFAETYREIYSKTESDPEVVEQTVRREILGKMLAESFQKNFSTQLKTPVEQSFFQKLGSMLRDFITFLQSKVTPKEVNNIDFFTQQVTNLLYNEELELNLQNTSPQSTAPIMYSVPENMQRLLDKFGKSVTTGMSGATEEEMAIQGAVSIFTDKLSLASALIKQVQKHAGLNQMVPVNISTLANGLLNQRESLELLRVSALKTAKSTPGTIDKLNTIRQLADQTLNTISELSGEILSVNDKEPGIIAQELLIDLQEESDFIKNSVSESIQNLDSKGQSQLQKDTNLMGRLFAHVGKMSNAFINIMSAIVKKMHNDSIQDTNQDFNTFIEKLLPYADRINKFFKGQNFLSTVDNTKLREAKFKYEYSIRKLVGDPAIKDVSEEDFIKKYSDYSSIEKGNTIYFAYDYFYKKGYAANNWAEQSIVDYYNQFLTNVEEVADLRQLEGGTSYFYNYSKNLSDRRSKYSEGDPLRKSENQDITEDRRRKSNIFNRDGSTKKGLTYIRYSEAIAKLKAGEITEKDVVSTNPKAVPFATDTILKQGDFVVVRNTIITSEEGTLAFDLLKWNQLNLSQEKNLGDIKVNFITAYEKKKASLKGKSTSDKNKELREWMEENVQLDMTDEYWNSFDTEIINYTTLKSISSSIEVATINQIEKKLAEYALQKSNILKIYKLVGDYKEIDANKITAEDKLLLEKLDLDASSKKKELQVIFEAHELDMYKFDSNPIVELNQSFYSLFEKFTGKRYESSSIQDKKDFFQGQYGMSAEKYSAFLNFEKTLSKKVLLSSITGKVIARYRSLAKDPTNLDSIREAYLTANAPSWYKRYDANTEYGNFIKDLNKGSINIEELLDKYVKGSDSSIYYNGKPLEMMQINPGFKFTLPVVQSTSELYDEYKATSDFKTKFNILMKMGGIDRIGSFPKEDMSWITNNPENLTAYIYMMDAHLNFLDHSDAMKSYNIFLRPQQRQGTIERYANFTQKGDKIAQLRDGLKERFLYREDDFIDAYKGDKIPKFGLYRIAEEELTDDILGSLVWATKQGNTYKNRLLNYGRITKAMIGLERQEFEKGKSGIDSNYYKIAKEMLDYNFFGKTTTMRMETNILGQKVDMAKVLMWFRGFAVKQALGFSPIVATTNVLSGVIQHQFLKWTGKNIYSTADDRALTLLAPLTSDSLKDVGDFNPTSKLNKLMYSFGVYNIEDRFKNAKYNKAARLLPEAAFGMMAVGNFALQSRVMLGKLMEIRLVDGKFKSWRDYSIDQKMKDKTLTDAQIKATFDTFKNNSMYDYLDDTGNFEMDRLELAGYTGDIKNDKSRAMGRIQDIGEQVTMEIKNHNEGQAARDPLASFALSLKKWLILANTHMFSRKRPDFESGGYEEGLIYSYKYMVDLVTKARKENISLATAYEGLEEHEKKNLKTTSIITASMITLFTLAFMMKKVADDDDEKDNYGAQLSNYMLLRSLNETFSANIGIGNSMYESLQSPVSSLNTLGNLTKVINVTNIGEEVTRGKYAGMDKYLASWIKLTYSKNLYTVKDADAILQTRQGYEFFTNQNALYHIFNMLPKKDKEEKE